MPKSITVLGAGAWGTALAMVLARAGHHVKMWSHHAETAEEINTSHTNISYLPHVVLPDSIVAETDLEKSVAGGEVVFSVIPAQFSGETWRQLPDLSVPLIICSKGIEIASGSFLSALAQKFCPKAPLAVLSGPNFAGEIAAGLPAATTLAVARAEDGEALASIFTGSNLRPYLSNDVRGVEIAGAVKNIMAIACGITAGKKLGESAKASLITRGLSEMTRFGVACGARPETFMGLSGVGDLTLTCSSPQSRNMSLGIGVGLGRTLDQLLGSAKSIAEGAYTVKAVLPLARNAGVEMPIAEAVYQILYEDAKVDTIIGVLLSRPLKKEGE